MIRLFHRTDSLWQEISTDEQYFPAEGLWVDLISPTLQEIAEIQARLDIEIPSREEMQEIEATSRLYRENDIYFMTAAIVSNPDMDDMNVSAVTFILADRFLVTVRYFDPKPFASFAARLQRTGSPFSSSTDIMIGLLETLIDRMADILELHSAEVERIAKLIFTSNDKQSSERIDLNEIIKDIGMEGNQFSIMRESLVSVNRMANYLNQSVAHHPRSAQLREMLKEIGRDLASLADHTSFMSGKISFLLDATLGMIDIEQNKIIKMLSVAAVFFLPPTLIASIYGMNFRFMPELSSRYGYPLAIISMIASALISYLYFKRKGWM